MARAEVMVEVLLSYGGPCWREKTMDWTRIQAAEMSRFVKGCSATRQETELKHFPLNQKEVK